MKKQPRKLKSQTLKARKLRKHATGPERRLWSVLRRKQLGGLRFRRQVPISGFIVDFYCESVGLVIEIDGESHATCGEYDLDRQTQLELQGFRVLRVSNDDVIQDLEAVAIAILRAAGIDPEDFTKRS